jgi:phosphohistidine swiveling domain-containing protein
MSGISVVARPGIDGPDAAGSATSAAKPGMANPLHWEATDPDVLWSPGNVSEAIPGVSTALNWSFIDDAIELASRRAFCAMGVLRRDEVKLNDRAEDRFMVCFYGRTVANIEAMRLIGDRMPGTSANAIEEQLFGVVRPEAANHPTYARVPAVAARMPRTASKLRRHQLRLRAEIVAWWRAAVLSPPSDLGSARELMREARELYSRAFELGVLSSMLSQALYDQVAALAETVGRSGLEHRLITGYADLLETGVVSDLHQLARNDMDLASFLLQHGFHGPDEGQIAGRVWREEPGPLVALSKRYSELGPEAHPAAAERRQRAVREEAEAELLGALGRVRAPAGRLMLRLARALIPQREVGKANYTQCLDGARIASRSIGRELVAAGVLDDSEDVFGLTYDEVVAEHFGRDPRELAAERSALREDYLASDLPDKWTGPPVRVPLGSEDGSRGPDGGDTVHGEGVGGGSVTARIRVVIDPATEELDPGEVLVCHSTDPGWVSLFHLAGGIAVDMGGQMSHGAIVARELGLPCVTCTVDGTRRLRTGDLVTLDGDSGRIEIIERQASG